MSDQALQIRSYAVVFDLERRIHRIDRFKVPLPYGLPLRSVGYTGAALLAVLVADGLPLLGAAIGALPAPLRLVLMPVAVGVLLTRLRLDGRSAHAACLAWLRFALSTRDVVAFRTAPSRDGQVRLEDCWTLDDAGSSRRRARSPKVGARGSRMRRDRVGGQLTFDGAGGEQLVMW